MDAAEKIIMLMRAQGMKNNPRTLRLGEMVSSTECRIGENIYTADDLYVAEHLTSTYNARITATLDAIIDDKAKKVLIDEQKIMLSRGLQTGDQVLVYQLSDESAVIIDKVVTADVSA